MKFNLLLKSMLVALLVTVSLTSNANSINFDGTGAPSFFENTTPLTNLYAGQGVTFSGIDSAGGSILNQSGNFGFDAHSGTDFLAFNTEVGTGNEELISFDTAVDSVSIWAASAFGGYFLMEALNANDELVDSYGYYPGPSDWVQIAVSGANIFKVRLTVDQSSSFAYDDLEYSPVSSVPVPAALPLMLSGLGVLGFARRNRKV